MKKLIITALLLVSFISCDDVKKTEIIDQTEKDSYNIRMNWASPEGHFKYNNEEWQKVTDLLKKQETAEPEKFKTRGLDFRSVIYFSDSGKLQKIVLLESAGNKIDKAVYSFLQQTFASITPPEINNKPVKSHTDFLFNYNPGGFNFANNFILPQKALEEVYLPWVEALPNPVGGMEDIVRRMKYPDAARNQGIEGRVFVKLYISETGKPEMSEVLKSVHPLLDTEARNVLMKTKFSPGRKGGKAVKTQVVVPILFQLEESKTNKKG